MKQYSLIIWDFNGTLIDDVDAALGAVNDMLTKRAQPQIDLSRYRSAVDIPIWKFYETIFEKGTITPEEAIEEFALGYERHLKTEPLMEGVRDVLEFFRKSNTKQIVLSASHIEKVRSRLQSLGVAGYFDHILGRSDDNVGDKSYLAKQYLGEYNIHSAEVLVIGDCINDFDVAQSLGCDCTLCSKGHHSRMQLKNTSALIVDSFYELYNLIST